MPENDPAGCAITGVDTHAHVFRRDLALADQRRYEPDYDATLEAFLACLDATGLSHGVLVQPSFLGTDNSYLLAALGQARERLRGVAVVGPDITDKELDRLAAGGIVAVRLNLIGVPLPDFRSAPWAGLLIRLSERGWPVEVHREARDLPVLLPALMTSGVAVIVDHFGRPEPEAGADDPGFRYLLSLGASGQVWVKLSAAYRIGTAGREASAAMAGMLLRHYGPTRLMWGSDWPHTRFERLADYSASRSDLDVWIPDSADRACVLAQTPAALFGFLRTT